MGEVTSDYFQSNDLNLHYINYKTNAHKPLIMLHGMRSYAQAWNDVAEQLVDNFDIYALDQKNSLSAVKSIQINTQFIL